jgi:hypothetical protein
LPKGRHASHNITTWAFCLRPFSTQQFDRSTGRTADRFAVLAPADELIVLDGKEPKHGAGHSVLTAVTVPSQHFLGSATVDTKTNEIPVARELFKKLELDGRKVSLDALHTQAQTARQLVLEHGADFLLTVKDNQPTVRENIERLVQAPPAAFSPSGHDAHAGGQA